MKKVEITAEVEEKFPYYTFTPSGYRPLEPWRLDFLREYLKAEDIPPKLDTQIDVICSRANIVACGGGNGGGKTAAAAIRVYIQATGIVPGRLHKRFPHELLPKKRPQMIRVCCISDSVLQNTLIPIYRQFAPKEFLKNGSWEDSYSSQYKRLDMYDGKSLIASIEFKTYQQDVESFYGTNLDMCVFDEEPPGAVYKACRMRFRIADRLFMIFSFTPEKGITWSYDLFVGNTEESFDNIESFKLSSVTNPKTKYEVLDEQFRMWKGKPALYDELRMKLLGDFISLSGFVYGSLFNKSVHVIEPFEITREKYIVYRGLDPHLVKPTVCVEVAVDREGFEYVCGTYTNNTDTEVVKAELAERAVQRNYRLGWTRCDKSANSTIKALGDRNIFLELGRGKNAIPALDTSEKFTGSIHAGVDTIKKLLKDKKLFIFNLPENRLLIQAFLTLERDMYPNEEKSGIKDKIREGKHDTHAALRYVHQRHITWIPPVETQPEGFKEQVYV